MRLSTHGTFKNAGAKPVRGKLDECVRFLDCGTLISSRLEHINRTCKCTSFGER